jgi:threonyl-tRNA synthetase
MVPRSTSLSATASGVNGNWEQSNSTTICPSALIWNMLGPTTNHTARILPVSDKFNDYAKSVESRLREHGFRVTGEYNPDKIGAKIRQATLDKVPLMLVIGDKEVQANGAAVRHRVKGDLGMMPIDTLIAQLEADVKSRTLD